MSHPPIIGETLITLADAAASIPTAPTRNTLQRWAKVGVKSPNDGRMIVLGSIKIGGRRWTSKEAVSRFLELLIPAQAEAEAVQQ